MDKLFFESWNAILRTVVISVLGYAALIILLRVSGKRTLSKMNAFDLVVTIALGSLLATTVLNKDVTLAEGITGFSMLVILQFLVTWFSVRSKIFAGVIKASPVLLVYDGQYQYDNMKKERIMKDEVLAALRKQGINSVEEVKAVVLETDSNLTVIKSTKQTATVLENVSA